MLFGIAIVGGSGTVLFAVTGDPAPVTHAFVQSVIGLTIGTNVDRRQSQSKDRPLKYGYTTALRWQARLF